MQVSQKDGNTGKSGEGLLGNNPAKKEYTSSEGKSAVSRAHEGSQQNCTCNDVFFSIICASIPTRK